MAVGLEHALHTECGAQLEQLFVFVRRIDQYAITRAAAAHDEDIVVVGTDDDLVHLDFGVRPVQRVVHDDTTSKPSESATGIWAGSKVTKRIGWGSRVAAARWIASLTCRG